MSKGLEEALSPIVAQYVESPAGERIIVAGLAGAIRGAVVGGIAGAATEIGFLPGAMTGALIYAPVSMAKQAALEAPGIRQPLEKIKKNIKEVVETNMRKQQCHIRGPKELW